MTRHELVEEELFEDGKYEVRWLLPGGPNNEEDELTPLKVLGQIERSYLGEKKRTTYIESCLRDIQMKWAFDRIFNTVAIIKALNYV